MNVVSVFRTSVQTPAEVERLKPLLDRVLKQAPRWNFDLEDRENILRVEGISNEAPRVIDTLRQLGYFCEELED